VNCTVTHVTRFEYLGPVHESIMEVRLAPCNDGRQERLAFELTMSPAATIFRYTDAFGNDVHYFDIVPQHQQLVLQARMRVRTSPERAIADRLEPSAWDTLKRLREDGRLWDFFEPSPRVPVSPAIRAFAAAFGLDRVSDPLTCVRHIGSAVHGALTYATQSTTVDTPIEEALEARRGVCQDFAHIALAIARAQGIPCRYVSGYLAPANDEHPRENLASHAWIEAWLPGLGWTALDPTHNLVAGERYIAVAVGRDYHDAAPTRGLFRGGPAGTLSVFVRIEQDSGAASSGEMLFPSSAAAPAPPPAAPRSDQ
jgi:transglutaminase-like putative cysteine protease